MKTTRKIAVCNKCSELHKEFLKNFPARAKCFGEGRCTLCQIHYPNVQLYLGDISEDVKMELEKIIENVKV